MTLSINDLSSYFGVATDTVERWVRQGRIAAFRQDGKLVFRKKDIDNWAAQQNIRLNRQDSPEKTAETAVPSLVQAFENGGIFHEIEATDKAGVISACINAMELVPDDFKEDLLERITDREKAMSTGIGKGIAIPHPREPLSYLPKSAIVTCTLNQPVDFQALDGKPVTVLFFLLANTLTHHLPLLAALSQCLKNTDFLALLESRPHTGILIEKMKQMDL